MMTIRLRLVVSYGERANAGASEIKSQTESNERARKRELEELKGLHDNKISSLKHQIKEL